MDQDDRDEVRLTVVGAGSWGTTLAALAARSKGRGSSPPTVLWSHEEDIVESINGSHHNPRYLPDVELPAGLRATGSIDEALAGAEAVVMAVPSLYFRDVFRRVVPALPAGGPVLSVVKGIERGTLMRMTEIIAEESGVDPALIGVLSGPNVAREVADGQPAATVIALGDHDWAARLQERFMSPSFRVYTNTDVVGCEISGAMKNVIGIAAGIADGLGFGANTKAALVTRGLAELARLGTALGGDPLTFLGLAGNGDLVATCSSERSRNHQVGVQLARGRSIERIVAEMAMVAEGVETTPGVLALAERHGVELPIAEQVQAVIERRSTPLAAVELLMARRPRAELEGFVAAPV